MNNDIKQEALDACTAIYLMYHVSMLEQLPIPCREAWYIGQKAYDRRKQEQIEDGKKGDI